MTAKPTFPPAETAAGLKIPGTPPKTTLRPDMCVIKKSGDTEFIGLVIDIAENGDGNQRMLVESLAPGARKIIHIYRPDQFRRATLFEINHLKQMTAIWDGAPANTAPAWQSPNVAPGRFPEIGGDPEPIPADLVVFSSGSAAPLPPLDRADSEFMPSWAHKALIAIVAIGAAFCAVMIWQSLAAINAGLAPV